MDRTFLSKYSLRSPVRSSTSPGLQYHATNRCAQEGGWCCRCSFMLHFFQGKRRYPVPQLIAHQLGPGQCCLSRNGELIESFALTTTGLRCFTQLTFHKALPFETVEHSMHHAKFHRTARVIREFAADRYAVRFSHQRSYGE